MFNSKKNKKKNHFDLIIVGAGPGGAVAAKTAAELKLSTLVLEKESLSGRGRYKACGGAMAQDLIDRVGFPQEMIDWDVDSLVLHYFGDESFEKEGKGAAIWRSTFDKYLVRNAQKLGAIIKDEEPLLDISYILEKKRYKITTNKEEYLCKYVIAADGVASKTLRCLGWPKIAKKDLVLTMTKEISCTPSFIEEHLGKGKLHLFFNIDEIPMGYAWLFPKGDTITVGWGNKLALINNTKKEFQKFCSHSIVSKILNNPQNKEILSKAHLIPVGARPILYKNNVFAVGDAGGLVDPISGKGIPYAMLSGKIAVETIKSCENSKNLENLESVYIKTLEDLFLSRLIKKKGLRTNIFINKESLKKFLSLWKDYGSSEILDKNLM